MIDLGAWFVTGSAGAAVSRTTTTEDASGATEQTLIGLDLWRRGGPHPDE